MRTGEKKRWVYCVTLSRHDKFGPCIYIAADNIQQAMNFAMTRNVQGYCHQIGGAVAYTLQTPVQLEIEASWLQP